MSTKTQAQIIKHRRRRHSTQRAKERQKRLANDYGTIFYSPYYIKDSRWMSDKERVFVEAYDDVRHCFERVYNPITKTYDFGIKEYVKHVDAHWVTKRTNYRNVPIKPFVKRATYKWKKDLKNESHRAERRYYRNISEYAEDTSALPKKAFGNPWHWD